MKQPSSADSGRWGCREVVPPAARGFTLLELLVAMAVASLLLVVLFSIIGDLMTSGRSTVQSLVASNSGSTALDTLAADLGGLMPLDGTNEYLFVSSEPSGGATNAYLRFLTQSPNIGTNEASGGQPCLVAYRVAQYDSKTLETTAVANPAYALFRMTTNATDSFAEIGSPINDSATDVVMTNHFFANNVVEFGVQAMKGTNTISTNFLSLKGNSPSIATRPDALVITLVTLDETGAQRLRDGAQSLEQIKTKHGRVLTRRIQLTEAFMP